MIDWSRGLCAPTIIAIFLGLISLAGAYSNDNGDMRNGNFYKQSIGQLLLITLLFTLCYNDYNTAAWVVLLLPVILGVFAYIILINKL